MKTHVASLFVASALTFSLAGAPGAAAAPADRGARPPSLAGTDVDGALRADVSGRFLVDVDARRLVDYFLSATGEEPPARIRARIDAEIDARLPLAARGGARAFLETYLAYRKRAAALPRSEGLESRFQALAALRREVFGESAARRLFGDEEDYDAAALRFLSRVREAPDEDLVSQRFAGLGTAERSAYDEALAPIRSEREESAARAGGASRSQIQTGRAMSFGEEAATRLEALDRERESFRVRVDAHRLERKKLESKEAVEKLLAARFTPAESLRVRALDRVDGIEKD